MVINTIYFISKLFGGQFLSIGHIIIAKLIGG